VVSEADDEGELLEDPTTPTGRPGSRAPHVALEGPAGTVSTIDLFGRGFVLLTGDEGVGWVDAAREVTDLLGIEITVHHIGRDGDLHDPSGTWCHQYGITPTGAVLVRPDRFIAWRSRESGTTRPEAAELEKALRTVLDR